MRDIDKLLLEALLDLDGRIPALGPRPSPKVKALVDALLDLEQPADPPADETQSRQPV